MRSLTRSITRALPTACGLILASCRHQAASDSDNKNSLVSSHFVQAANVGLGSTSVLWLSRRELCVVGVELRTIDECAPRQARFHPDSVYEQVRKAVKVVPGARDIIKCARFSAELASGDSSVILLSTIGGTAVDGVAEARSTWVWFKRVDGRDSVWIGRNEAPVSDVAPIEDESKC